MSDLIWPVINLTGISPTLNSMFDRLQTAEATPLFNYTSNYGISAVRDVISTTGSGTVTNTQGFYQVATPTSPNATAILDTAERGKLFPGNSFEAGVSVRIPTAPTGTQKATWGYFDGSNGAYFGQDATGIFVAVLNNSVEIFKVYQSSWNVDRLDGSGPSKLTLNTTVGKMFQIRFGYEYGIIEFRIVFVNTFNFQQIVVCHRQSQNTNGVLLSDPNQVIRVQVQNGGGGGAFSANVRGRYYAILGPTVPTNRITSESRLNMTVGAGAFIPTISFRRKGIFPDGSNRNNSVNVQISSFDILASNDLRWQLRYGSTLTGASFGNISDTPSSETCCQADVSATAINTSTGIKLMSGFAKGGQHSAQQRFPVDTVLNGTTPVTLAITSLSGNATCHIVFRVHEDW
ncbi:hypothetical protein MHZ95_17820 [Sporosarcina sp. ACRSM]|uniref:hypothetical protein n=1 Tax=Sporosarcina sp. ACRSM TaxID=2918216 RepID=UPI001EF54A7C|nr:hypothetical protein [Sporosarcina sp. ACRSM]